MSSFLLYTYPVCTKKEVIDSLQQVLKSNISDKEKVDTYVRLAEKYSDSDSSKTVKYATKARELATKINYTKGKIEALHEIAWVNLQKGNIHIAERLFKQEIQEAEANNNLKSKAYGLNGLGILADYQGNYEKALTYHFQALEIRKKLNNPREIGVSYSNIGFVYEIKGDNQKALEFHLKSFEIYKKIGAKKDMGYAYSDIGLIYSSLGNYEQALEYYFKSLEIFEELEDKQGISYSFDNIGLIYKEQEEYEQALEYYFKSLEIFEESGNKLEISALYQDIGAIYQIRDDYDTALGYYQKSLEIYQEVDYKAGVGFSYTTIGFIYLEQDKLNEAKSYFSKALELYEIIDAKAEKPLTLIGIGKVYMQQQKWELAQNYLYQAITLAQEMGVLANIRDIAEQLALVEKELGNYKAAYEYHTLFKQMADSLKNKEQIEKLTRLEMNYEFSKEKDSIQTANEKEQLILEKDIKNRKNTQIATYIGLGLLGVLLLISYLFLRSKQKSNQLLTQKSKELTTVNQEIQVVNEELKTANEEIQTINDTLLVTLDTVEKQRDEILSSIQYAQRIQSSILPNPKQIQRLLPEHFILFKPRDVVSGDFYYIKETQGKIILAAVDCTGHGIPGAFMSLIGYTALLDINVLQKITKAAQILEWLHIGVRYILRQKESEIKDGMDMALVVIDKENKTLDFAGAKNPLIYIQNGKLHKIKGDIMGIGGVQTEMERHFAIHTIDISEPTTFYLFSDGYHDQFGGKKGKKFMTKRFRELLFEIHEKPMEEQKSILEKKLTNWMGKEEQVDDILVMGVKV